MHLLYAIFCKIGENDHILEKEQRTRKPTKAISVVMFHIMGVTDEDLSLFSY